MHDPCLHGYGFSITANGTIPDIIERAFDGEDLGTLFLSRGQRIGSRKRWIGYTLQPRGIITVDQGAVEALRSGKRSLLPAGYGRLSAFFTSAGC